MDVEFAVAMLASLAVLLEIEINILGSLNLFSFRSMYKLYVYTLKMNTIRLPTAVNTN